MQLYYPSPALGSNASVFSFKYFKALIMLLLLLVSFIGTPNRALDIHQNDDWFQRANNNIVNTTANFVLSVSQIPKAHLNPSIAPSNPIDSDAPIIAVWTLSTDIKLGYSFYNLTLFESLKAPDWIEEARPVSEGVYEKRTPLTCIDPHLFYFNSTLHLICLKIERSFILGPLLYDKAIDMFYVPSPYAVIPGSQLLETLVQPTVMPFEYCFHCSHRNGIITSKKRSSNEMDLHLLLITSINPHRIEYYNRASKDREVLSITRFPIEDTWLWGVDSLVSGTPALRVGKAHYLAFFYSVQQSQDTFLYTYYLGAYLFHARPPFGISHITVAPISHKSFAAKEHLYAGLTCVISPTSFLLINDTIKLSYGLNALGGSIMTLNRTEFLASMKPINNTQVVGDSSWTHYKSFHPNSFKLFTDVK